MPPFETTCSFQVTGKTAACKDCPLAQRQLDLDSDDDYNWTPAEGEARKFGRPWEAVWSQTNR